MTDIKLETLTDQELYRLLDLVSNEVKRRYSARLLSGTEDMKSVQSTFQNIIETIKSNG